jgi:hypothetical protein
MRAGHEIRGLTPGSSRHPQPFCEKGHVMAAQNHTAATVEYKEIPRLPGYRFGDDGSYWSRRIRGRVGLRDTWTRLKGTVCRRGYRRVCVHIDNKPDHQFLHRLILEAFVGPRPPGMEACHRNGDRLDNRLCNLRWGTPESNVEDKWRHGNIARGERIANSRLTKESVAGIRLLASEGKSTRILAEQFGVGHTTIRNVVQKRTWKWPEND